MFLAIVRTWTGIDTENMRFSFLDAKHECEGEYEK